MQFYFAALTSKTDFTCSYDVLQLPFGNAESSFGINLGTNITDIRTTHPDFPDATTTGTRQPLH